MTASATLDRWAQDSAFTATQQRMVAKYGWEWAMLQDRVLAIAERGPFTADDVMDGVREVYPPNLIGAVLGCLRATHRIRVVDRAKSRHREAKGRWINRFTLNQEAPA